MADTHPEQTYFKSPTLYQIDSGAPSGPGSFIGSGCGSESPSSEGEGRLHFGPAAEEVLLYDHHPDDNYSD